MAGKYQNSVINAEQMARNTLQWLWNEGHKDIKYLMKATGMSRATVFRNISKIKSGKDVNRKPGTGVSLKLKGNDKRRVTQLARRNPLKSCTNIAVMSNESGSPEVSPTTIWRSLKSSGYHKWTPKIIPKMTPKHMENRVKWCQNNKNRDWTKVIFTDESYFQLYRHKVKMWGRKRPEKQSPKHGPAIMVWRAISSRGTSTLSMTKGSITADKYQEILNENMKSIEVFYPEGFTFQQDNAAAHTARSTKNWFSNRGYDVIEWPACSPDLNPIENCWRIMKDALEREIERSHENWIAKIQKIWDEVVPKHLESLINSMPRRLEQCIAANGKKINY